jgi:hypothetical protein
MNSSDSMPSTEKFRRWLRSNTCPHQGRHGWKLRASAAARVCGMSEPVTVVQMIEESSVRKDSAETWRIVRRDFGRPVGSTLRIPSEVRRPDPYDPRIVEGAAISIPLDAMRMKLAALSPVDPRSVGPTAFLWHLYVPGEHVAIVSPEVRLDASGQAVEWMETRLWKVPVQSPAAEDALLSSYRSGRWGVFFVTAPTDGHWRAKPEGGTTAWSECCIVRWPFLLLESDKVEAGRWLSWLIEQPARFAAVYTSGKRSVHALVRLDAESKEEWIQRAVPLRSRFIPAGADSHAMTALRQSRLPGCIRGETGNLQELLYLNPAAPDCPISHLPRLR